MLKAIREAGAQHLPESEIPLYLSKETGLANIPFSEIREVMTSMEDEELIEIVHHPRMSLLLEDDKIMSESRIELLPPMLKTLILHKQPQNHYSIRINDGPFGLVYANYLIPVFLSSAMPSDRKNKKYKDLRKIADLLIDAGYNGIERYKVASSFIKIYDRNKGKNKNLDRQEYIRNKKYYDEQIENRLKTLKKKLEPKGYTIKRTNDVLKISEI